MDDLKHTAYATSLVQTYVPQARLRDSSGRELSYAVPEDADRASLKGLFQALEQNQRRLCLTGCGLSDPSLEEVPGLKRLLSLVLRHCLLADEVWVRRGEGLWTPAFAFTSGF